MGPEIRTLPLTYEQEAARSETLRRIETRQGYLVPISVMWGTDVPPLEAEAALEGVKDVLEASGQDRQLMVYGSDTFAIGDYSSATWYISEAFRNQGLRRDAGYGPQLVTSEMFRLLANEPWQENPHWEVFVVNQDLNTRINGQYINFVFGETQPDFAASVQSVARIRAEIPNPRLRTAMVRRLLRHEVGHMFGLVNRDFNREFQLGEHCTNVCSMRQGMSMEVWARQLAEEEQAGIHFCQDCQNDLIGYKEAYKPLSELPDYLK